MLIPPKMPGQKWFIILWAVAAVTYMILEGNLGLAVLLGLLTAIITVILIFNRYFAGRNISLLKWLAVTAFLGLVFGVGSAIFSLTFMAVKTGLHAHGPEFTSIEINWVLQQIPVWAVSGLAAGVALGLLLKAFLRR
jgi:hypothetical protein